MNQQTFDWSTQGGDEFPEQHTSDPVSQELLILEPKTLWWLD
jgi:hypothetical protein